MNNRLIISLVCVTLALTLVGCAMGEGSSYDGIHLILSVNASGGFQSPSGYNCQVTNGGRGTDGATSVAIKCSNMTKEETVRVSCHDGCQFDLAGRPASMKKDGTLTVSVRE